MVDSVVEPVVEPVERYTVGLTGGIGSGKTTVSDRFARLGATIVDADVVAHRLTAAGGAAIDAVRALFGEALIGPDGALARAAMRALVFSDPAARLRLEGILHPLIRVACDRERDAATGPYVVLVVPLLFESATRAATMQRTLVVTCAHDVQIVRVMQRSGLSSAEVEAIIAAQMPAERRSALADDEIDNSGEPADLDGPVAALHARYLALAGRHAP